MRHALLQIGDIGLDTSSSYNANMHIKVLSLLAALCCAILTSPSAQADATSQRIVTAARRQIGTRYTQAYYSLKYPNGDPPKSVGACTDVVIRSLRAAGHDLQKLIHEDMKRNFALYPRKWQLQRTDKNIDHRRVLNQRVYFARFAQALPKRADQGAWKQWQPGDIIYWKFENSLDHCGIISDRRAPSGRPLVIHNLGGCREEDVMTAWKIVDHFRFPRR
ncbi:MAG: uncharacterized protein JWN98_1656 [Abditibacteriota bacterium]|nr:uncharacterized protein [Abditibacteriota bacterium]